MDKNVGKEILFKERKRILFFGLPFSFTKYTCDKNLLTINKGFIRTKEDEVRLYRIMDISLERSLLQRIVGLGTIKVISSDKFMKNFDIKNIKRSKDVKNILSDAVEESRRSNRVSTREFMDSHDEDCNCDNENDSYDGFDEVGGDE